MKKRAQAVGVDPYWGYRLLCFYSEGYSRSSRVVARARRTTEYTLLFSALYIVISVQPALLVCMKGEGRWG